MADRGTLTTNTSVETDLRGGSSKTPYVTLLASGTWGGATVKVQAGFYNAAGTGLNWVDIEDVDLTANGCVTFAINAHKLRVTCTGGTAHSIAWALV